MYVFFYLCFCLFHVHRSWYKVNIKILVCHIIGPAAAGSAAPVPIRPWADRRTRGSKYRAITASCGKNKLSRSETICPRRSRLIYVRAQTDPQSVQLWPGRGAARAYSWPRCDQQTDGSRHRSTHPPTAGHKYSVIPALRRMLNNQNYWVGERANGIWPQSTHDGQSCLLPCTN